VSNNSAMDGQIFAIGDIHGRFDLMQRALAKIERLASQATVVFLGDYIDRGPQSKETVAALMRGPQRPGDRWICLKGNHEEMLVAAHSGVAGEKRFWLENGGDATLRSFGGDIPDPILAWCRDLPLSYETERYFFVHAGIRPGVPFSRQDARAMLWIRDRFLDDERDHGKHVVHGHTPFDAVQLHANRTNLDTMAFMSGRLSVGQFDLAAGGGPKAIIEAT
jgi:serine/threonine protein phosphatase 1